MAESLRPSSFRTDRAGFTGFETGLPEITSSALT